MKTSALLCAFVASASAFAPQQQVAARAPALNGVPLANGKFRIFRWLMCLGAKDDSIHFFGIPTYQQVPIIRLATNMDYFIHRP